MIDRNIRTLIQRLRPLGAAFAVLAALLAGQTPARAAAPKPVLKPLSAQAAAAPALPSVKTSPATLVGQLSGQATPGIRQLNNTAANNSFYGGDLATMWSGPNGVTRVAYGDSDTSTFTTSGGPGNGSTICNAVFLSNTPASSLSTAMQLTNPNGTTGYTQMAPCGTTHQGLSSFSTQCSSDAQPASCSILPIGGVYVGNADYVKFTILNVGNGRGPGSYVMKSTDDGRTWADVPGLSWTNSGADTNFQYSSYVSQNGYVYMFNTLGGRYGSIYLARVPVGQFETKSAYQYWNGLDWGLGDSSIAAPIVAGPVDEPSVQFDPALNLWLMTYLNDANRGSIVLRYASSPAGPWSGEQVVMQSTNSPAGTGGAYGGFIHPGATGTDLYIAVSEWTPYQVYLMHVPLTAGSGALNLVTDGDFSDPMAGYSNTNAGNPVAFGWSVLDYGKVDVGLGNGYQSPNEGYLYNSNQTFTDFFQTIAVQPYHEYTYTAWVRTSASAGAVYVGVRNMAQTVHWEDGPLGPLSGYTPQTVTFNSGANSQVQVYAGMWVSAGVTTWLQLGQAQLVQNATLGDGGFEYQTSNTPALPWHEESLKTTWTGWDGIDVNQGWAHSGANNAYIRTNTGDWNAFKQVVPVRPNTTYTLSGWIRTSATFGNGFLGARSDISSQVLTQTWFGSTGAWTQVSMTVNSGANDFLTVYAGYWGPGSDSWVQIDDVSVV